MSQGGIELGMLLNPGRLCRRFRKLDPKLDLSIEVRLKTDKPAIFKIVGFSSGMFIMFKMSSAP